jgi:hypothetical protein
MPKLETISGRPILVDKLPSSRDQRFFRNKRGGFGRGGAVSANASMATDRAKKGDDEVSYALDEQSTIDEESIMMPSSLDDRDAMSMSANSSANFSFNTRGETDDAYPALYNPELQSQYEKTKIEEKERMERESFWGPAIHFVDYMKGGMTSALAKLETCCVYDMK